MFLETAPQSKLGAQRRRHIRDVVALKVHASVGWPVKTRDGVEERRLAGAVGADDRSDGAARHLETDITQRAHATKGQSERVNLQQRWRGDGAGLGRCLHRLSDIRVCAE